MYGVAAGVFHRKIISWGTTGHTLIEASLDSEARRIVLVTDVQNQHGNTRVTRRLPFPEGAIDEAESLVARYNQIVADRSLS